MSFYRSYSDPDTICFSLKSNNDKGIFRERDWISLKLDKLIEAQVLIHAYIHYPGRLTREIGKPNFEIHPDELAYLNDEDINEEDVNPIQHNQEEDEELGEF